MRLERDYNVTVDKFSLKDLIPAYCFFLMDKSYEELMCDYAKWETRKSVAYNVTITDFGWVFMYLQFMQSWWHYFKCIAK